MSIKLLLADNSISVQKVVELALTDQDVELATVGDGSAALERAKEVVPDVLLADIELPELDGYSLCRLVKEEPATRAAKVVLLKRAFADYDRGRADAVGADGMLEKPFKAAALLRALGIEGGAGEEPEAVEATEVAEEAEAAEVAEDAEAAEVAEAEGGPPAPSDESVFELMEDALAIDPSEVPPEESPFDMMEKALVEESAIETTAEAPETPAAEEEAAAAEAEADVSDEVSFRDLGVLDEEEAEAPIAPAEFSEAPVAPAESGIDIAAAGGELEAEELIEIAEAEAEEDRVLDFKLEEMPAPPPPQADDAAAAREGRELIEKIVRHLGDNVIREVAWEVVPDLAERLIREAIEKITAEKPD